MERASTHELHHQTRSEIVFLKVENFHNPRMIQQSGANRLITKHHQMFLVIGSRSFQNLECHDTNLSILRYATRPENPSTSTPTRDFKELIRADPSPDPDFRAASGTADHGETGFPCGIQ
jgi:hypothetical protein